MNIQLKVPYTMFSNVRKPLLTLQEAEKQHEEALQKIKAMYTGEYLERETEKANEVLEAARDAALNDVNAYVKLIQSGAVRTVAEYKKILESAGQSAVVRNLVAEKVKTAADYDHMDVMEKAKFQAGEICNGKTIREFAEQWFGMAQLATGRMNSYAGMAIMNEKYLNDTLSAYGLGYLAQ